MSAVGAMDARLEIECVFGVVSRASTRDNSDSVVEFDEPPVLLEQCLHFKDAERILETPHSEIHYVVEPWASPSRQGGDVELTTEEMSRLLASHGIRAQQAIRYRSEAMRIAGSQQTKLIATSYYESPALAVAETRRLVGEGNLFREFSARGYSLRMDLERIYACFKPLVKRGRELHEKLQEVG